MSSKSLYPNNICQVVYVQMWFMFKYYMSSCGLCLNNICQIVYVQLWYMFKQYMSNNEGSID